MRYFRNVISVTLLVSILLLIVSCKKDLTPVKNYDPTEGIVSLIKNDNGSMPGKYVFFQFNQSPDTIDTSASFNISVLGKFTDDITGAVVNAGDIIINDSITIASGRDNLYDYKFDQATLPVVKASMGNYIDLHVTGSSSSDSLKRKLYIPKQIFLYNLYKSISTISNNKSYNLTWNADPQNMFGKVLIDVSYYSGISVYNNPGNPASVKGLLYTVSDNGSFVIPAEDLKRFPASSYISISLSRASDNMWPTNRSHIEYIAVLTASTSPILVQN